LESWHNPPPVCAVTVPLYVFELSKQWGFMGRIFVLQGLAGGFTGKFNAAKTP